MSAAVERHAPAPEAHPLATMTHPKKIIGESPALKRVLQQIEMVAPTELD